MLNYKTTKAVYVPNMQVSTYIGHASSNLMAAYYSNGYRFLDPDLKITMAQYFWPTKGSGTQRLDSFVLLILEDRKYLGQYNSQEDAFFLYDTPEVPDADKATYTLVSALEDISNESFQLIAALGMRMLKTGV